MLIWRNCYYALFDFKIQNLDCTLLYIPEHLHTNDKSIIDQFTIGEKLFYRCNPNDLSKPYDKINLYDISHNRNFCNDVDYGSDCVLFEATGTKGFQKHESSSYITLLLKKISGNTFYKLFLKTSPNDESVKIELCLKHDPIPCMYPHSIFEIKINEVVVTKDNYESEFGKKNKFYSNLRNEIRQELTSIIQTGFIDDTELIEIIKEP